VPVILGGDGTVALWAVRTLLPKSDELSVLHVDAHADLSSAEDGLGETHHTVMRRILELSPAPHICQVGIRSLTRDGFDKIVEDDVSVECFFMSDIHRAADESWHEDVIQELRSPVYLSLDLSAFDPGVLPAVAHPEPGGLEWWPTLRLLRKIASRRRIAGMDISGLAPRPGVINSDYAAAKLAYKLMNYILAGGKMLDKEGPEIGEEEEYEEEESPFEE
jgi:agmatinase